MAFLEGFTDEERDLLVSVPYRAGLWLSQADGTGNPGASADERHALEGVIAQQARGMFYSAFVHEVMSDLWSRRLAWDDWSKDLARVPEDCMKAAHLLAQKMARRDLDAYRATIMTIATEVAKAFRESPAGNGAGAELIVHVKLWLGRMGSFLRGEPYDPLAIANISKIEDKALSRLADALSSGAESVNSPI